MIIGVSIGMCLRKAMKLFVLSSDILALTVPASVDRLTRVALVPAINSTEGSKTFLRQAIRADRGHRHVPWQVCQCVLVKVDYRNLFSYPSSKEIIRLGRLSRAFSPSTHCTCQWRLDELSENELLRSTVPRTGL
jgi:hypothetical protein